jgi:hypothetical protein
MQAPPFFEGSLAWESSPSLPGGCALIAASTELDDRPGPSRAYLVRLWRDLLDLLVGTVRSVIEECQFRPDLDVALLARDPGASGRVRRTATAEGRLGAADTGARLAHSPSTRLVLS